MVWESLKILVSVVQFRPEPPFSYGTYWTDSLQNVPITSLTLLAQRGSQVVQLYSCLNRSILNIGVILVCHCYRSAGNVIRIISARKASPKESKAYSR